MFSINWRKKEENERDFQWLRISDFRVRRLDFSLKYRKIRPSAVVGTRREADLREETYAWAPDLRSFEKLREVGVSPYLGFTLCLRAMLKFRLVEALNGHLIGPKTWDRSVRNYGTHFGQSVNGYGLFECIV